MPITGPVNVGVLIPAYNPGKSLLRLAESLMNLAFQHIVIVNDGSNPECKSIFAEVEKLGNCHVLHHAVNLGKGRALKTGLNYCYINFPDLPGIVTADADGQHLPEDILKVSETFLRNTGKLVLGARKFARGIPLRSLIGNMMTRYVFGFLVGKKLSDTQSGLRCIPMGKIPGLLRLAGEGYEYEMNMLIASKASNTDIVEEEIAAVYLDNNRSSHFNPFIDSMKIYFLLLRFSFSSLFSSFIDFVVFAITFSATSSILTSIIVARIISVNVNFIINRKLVFHSTGGHFITILKFYTVATLLGSLSFLIVNYFYSYFGLNVILAKALTETFLFLFGFVLQRDFIFHVTKENE
ncbi:MAG: glycosyltransferase [Dissulfurispiraceae bacterium]